MIVTSSKESGSIRGKQRVSLICCILVWDSDERRREPNKKKGGVRVRSPTVKHDVVDGFRIPLEEVHRRFWWVL
jgi:hypothetical protein